MMTQHSYGGDEDGDLPEVSLEELNASGNGGLCHLPG